MKLLQGNIDAILNYFSFALLGASAILANMIVVAEWDVAALGAFNQAVGIFIVVAQFSVVGQQNAMLYESAHYAHDPDRLGTSLACAYIIVVLSGLLAALLTYYASLPIALLLKSPDVGFGLRLIAPALIFTAIVKVAMQTLNGLGHVKLYALLQGVRPLLIIAGLVAAAGIKLPARWLIVTMTVAEFITMLIAIALLAYACPVPKLHRAASRMAHMLKFGIKSSPAGILGELNTRVDYFVLGIFRSDAVVGAYSFAAALAEGFFLAIAVLRVLITPQLADLVRNGNAEEFRTFASRWKWRAGVLGLVAFVLSVTAYLAGMHIPGVPQSLRGSFTYYAILAIGVAVASSYIPFGNILLLASRPGLHSVYFSGLVLLNLVANFALTPSFGPLGTATSTALAYIASAVWLAIICRKTLALPL